MVITELQGYIIELESSEEYSDNMLADELGSLNWTLM